MMLKIIYFVGQLFFLPHLVVFLFCNQKEAIIEDLYARNQFENKKFIQYYDLSKMLLLNKFFRTLFYHRTRSFLTPVLRFFFPSYPTFFIDFFTKIDKGLILAHPYSTILNAKSIGKNVYVNHLVTIGEKNGQKPIIEDGVQLHAGCIIIGGITIGKNSIVGAGAVVVKNVPANSIVVGNPAKILEKFA